MRGKQPEQEQAEPDSATHFDQTPEPIYGTAFIDSQGSAAA